MTLLELPRPGRMGSACFLLSALAVAQTAPPVAPAQTAPPVAPAESAPPEAAQTSEATPTSETQTADTQTAAPSSTPAPASAPPPPVQDGVAVAPVLTAEPSAEQGSAANTKSSTPPAEPSGAETSLAPEPTVESKPKPAFRSILLLEGSAKYGLFATVIGEGSIDDENVETSNETAGQFAGQAMLGLLPGGGTFMMGGRLRAGAYANSGGAQALFGADILFGANFARRDGKNFAYAMGGMGVELVPSQNLDILTLQAIGGVVANGLNFGGGLEVGANEDTALIMFGMHVGWGSLF